MWPAKWKWEWGCRGSSPTRLKTARSAQEASATRPLHAAAAGRPFSNLSFPRGVIAKFDVGQEDHVSKTGLVLAFGPGVNGFASLKGRIPGLVVDGPIWHICASSWTYSAFYSFLFVQVN